ncbi:MAG: 3D-(3,5/4)-trihydroxycyclohexane-1,2-dione acylhydrolase (decyclizing) [Acetobacteraceae bacterium]|nr:3D-(3,5/4)-trihydroxycyclohexane-1,2-dione acylhydrolase (decyclizing) [Acetobacteraceae bacterium]
MGTIRLTMAQALVRFLAAQRTEYEGREVPLFAGVWAIFGHGNVAGLGEALAGAELPTYRAHNEQAMAHAAIAFAKACRRRRMMACTTSIGPGATNMVTAAALAHVNRLPVLLLPGDVFATRRPDPVLQQVEDFSDATVSASDCFRPVSRFFDRITRPEQILDSLPRAMAVLTDPALCGPVTLGVCQDVQAEAYDYPEAFFAPRIWMPRRPRPDEHELAAAAAAIRAARRPVMIAGGGVHYSGAFDELRGFAERHGIPVCETQAGKSALPADNPMNLGAVGVTGTGAANKLVGEADVVLAVGTRLADFTTGSWALLAPEARIVGLNIQPLDATKRAAFPLVADARVGLEALSAALGDFRAPSAWTDATQEALAAWQVDADMATVADNRPVPSDAQVIGAVQRAMGGDAVVVCAAGGLPAELHKLWRADTPGSYHLEYGYSCMGYEIAGGLGVKLARPQAEVVVMVGDGSYLMLNSEIATSVGMGKKLVIVLLDNGGFGCIHRLQRASGSPAFNNLLDAGRVDFRAHAESLGAVAERVRGIAELEQALRRAKTAERTFVVVIETDPLATTKAGGFWWDVGVPEVSVHAEVTVAYETWQRQRARQRLGN